MNAAHDIREPYHREPISPGLVAIACLPAAFIPPTAVGVWSNSVQLAVVILGLSILLNTAFLAVIAGVLWIVHSSRETAIARLHSATFPLLTPPVASLVAAGWVLAFVL